MPRRPPKAWRFTKEDAKKCQQSKGNRKRWGKCMAKVRKERMDKD